MQQGDFMDNFILSCCSTADLSEEHFKKMGVSYICFHFSLNGKQYRDDLGKSFPFNEFYKEIENGAEVKTSQVTVGEYIDYFTPFLESGNDILHICFSSGLSGSYNSAVIAKNTLQEQFPNRKIYIVDSLAASSGYGLLMDKLANLKNSGYSIEELYKFANEHKLEVHHWFFTTDLSQYIKGGRISKASGFVGTLLKICPLLNVDYNGKLIPRFKVRTKDRVIKEIVSKMEQNAVDGVNYSGKCYISQSACYDDAKAVADLVESCFKNIEGKVEINNIGTTVGSHCGPGTVALFFWGNKRND